MRRLILALALLALAAVPASAAGPEIPGWTAVDCHCSQAVSIDAVDNERIFLGTASGVRRSDDGGFTWHALSMPASGSVTRVSFADRNHGVAVGSFEGVIVTQDGGDTWKQFRPFTGTPVDVRALPGRLLGLATSGVYSSVDGGVVWKRNSNRRFSLNARMHWSSATTGVVVDAPNVLTTTDGGASFTVAPRTVLFLNDGLTLGPHEALAIGASAVHSGAPLFEHITGTSTTDVPVTGRGVAEENVHGIAGIGGVLYAAGEEGLLARSSDNGSTWAYETPPPSYDRSHFYAVDSLDSQHAWVAGYAGRVLIRNASTLHDVSTSPHRGLGIGLLGLTGLLGVGGAWALVTKKPKPVAGVLAGLTVLAGAGGTFAVTDSSTCRPSGCGTVSALPEPSRSPRPSPTPSPTLSPTPSPTPSPTASPTPSPSASPTASPTPSATPTPLGAFTMSPLSRNSSCGYDTQTQQGTSTPVTFTLRNTTATPVTWSATAREDAKSGQTQWATLSSDQGTLLPGASKVITVTPDKSLCTPGDPDTTNHLDVTYGPTQTLIAATVVVSPFTG